MSFDKSTKIYDFAIPRKPPPRVYQVPSEKTNGPAMNEIPRAITSKSIINHQQSTLYAIRRAISLMEIVIPCANNERSESTSLPSMVSGSSKSDSSKLEAQKTDTLSSHSSSRSWLSRLHPSCQTTEDAVMGTSDGMTVPFALTASLAGIAPNARYVMLAGLAELTAGAISMALGGALQARCEK